MSSTPPGPGPDTLRGIHVLIVDDNADARAIYKRTLQYAGAAVHAVPSATAAVRTLKHLRPDVVLTDLAMPRKDGLWLIRWIRARSVARSDRLPVAAITARDDLYAETTVTQAGFDLYLRKPVSALELLGAVGKLAGRRLISERSA
jgi:CheY-like chemotaxis protein